MDSTSKIGQRLNSLDGSLSNNDAVYLKKSGDNRAADKTASLNAKTLALKNALEGGAFRGEDTVNFSVSQDIQAALGDDSAARSKKIADLKAKIEQGDYKVDSRVVAKELASEIAQTIYFESQSNKKDDSQLF